MRFRGLERNRETALNFDAMPGRSKGVAPVESLNFDALVKEFFEKISLNNDRPSTNSEFPPKTR